MFWDVFARLCQIRKISPNAVAKHCGVKSTGTVTAWKNGAIPRDGVLKALADYFGVSTDFLLGVGAEPYLLITEYKLAEAKKAYDSEKNPEKLKELALEIELLQESVEDQRMANALVSFQSAKNGQNSEIKRDNIDLYSRLSALDAHGRDAVSAILEIEEARMQRHAERKAAYIVPIRTIRHYFEGPAAGVNGLVDGEDYEDIPLPAGAPEDADYCLTVSGDSMEPYFADGDMVYVKRDVPLRDFEVGVFAVDGATYIKQYCNGAFGEVYLLSANPKRESANITIKPDGNQSCVCQGKVITNKKLPQPIYD